MSGNVAEWCMDWYGGYLDQPQSGPSGVSTGTYRLLRGGSTKDTGAISCRVADRIGYLPNEPYIQSGFRVVLVRAE